MDLDFALLSPYLSEPEIVKFPTAKGGGQNAFAAFYRPQNKDFEAPPGSLPPLLVKIHGKGGGHVLTWHMLTWHMLTWHVDVAH